MVKALIHNSPQAQCDAIQGPPDKGNWKCVFKCRPGVPASDPLFEASKEEPPAQPARRIDLKVGNCSFFFHYTDGCVD